MGVTMTADRHPAAESGPRTTPRTPPGERDPRSRIEDLQMSKKKGAATSSPTHQAEPVPPKKPTIVGTDHALSWPTAQGTSLHLSYWDLWFALVAVKDFGGDLDRLANRIKEEKGFFYDRDSIERKRSHL